MPEIGDEGIADSPRRETGEPQAEQDDQHQPEPEGGQAEDADAEDSHGLIGPAPPVAGRGNRQAEGQEDREHQPIGQEEERRRQPLEDDIEDRGAKGQRLAEIGAQQVHHVIAVLHQQRLIEAVAGTHGRDRFQGRAGSQHDAHGIPRRQLGQDERHQADAEQDQDELQGAPQHEGISIHE